jgi:hypothetical protein
MFNKNRFIGIILLTAGFCLKNAFAQPVDLVLQDTTIGTTSTFTAVNSITSGPNFLITNSGNVTFKSGNYVTLNPGTTVRLGGLLQVFTGVTVDVKTETLKKPDKYILMQNYPNPFNPTTAIGFGLPQDEYVTIVIYNLFGEKIKTLLSDYCHAGYHLVNWDGRNEIGKKVSSGVFLYKIDSGKYSMIRKMILMK